jgi:hypothetical protein
MYNSLSLDAHATVPLNLNSAFISPLSFLFYLSHPFSPQEKKNRPVVSQKFLLNCPFKGPQTPPPVDC